MDISLYHVLQSFGNTSHAKYVSLVVDDFGIKYKDTEYLINALQGLYQNTIDW